MPIVIGLLGGVASGKSTVARAFAAHGLHHVDADRIAREVSDRPEMRAALADAFGPSILGPDGKLDRAALAALAFGDPAARRRLEAITHPPIRRAILAEVDAAVEQGRSVLLDVPLLLEGGLIERCDRTVFVAASEPVRRARARERGWSEGELERREAAQAPLAAKRARAGYTIDNDGPVERIAVQVAGLLPELAAG